MKFPVKLSFIALLTFSLVACSNEKVENKKESATSKVESVSTKESEVSKVADTKDTNNVDPLDIVGNWSDGKTYYSITKQGNTITASGQDDEQQGEIQFEISKVKGNAIDTTVTKTTGNGLGIKMEFLLSEDKQELTMIVEGGSEDNTLTRTYSSYNEFQENEEKYKADYEKFEAAFSNSAISNFNSSSTNIEDVRFTLRNSKDQAIWISGLSKIDYHSSDAFLKPRLKAMISDYSSNTFKGKVVIAPTGKEDWLGKDITIQDKGNAVLVEIGEDKMTINQKQ